MTKTVFWLACVESKDGKNYAYGVKVREGENIVNLLERYPHNTTMHTCRTKKECAELVEYWNTSFVDNGTHAVYGGEYPRF